MTKEEHIQWLDEEERWSPISKYLDIEDCYEVSSYGRIRNTKYGKILDDIHHSTNGFDYIFIATKDHKPSYQHIDLIVCMTFWAWNVNNLPSGEPIIPNHIDGDTRNNKASNLEFVLDKEILKPIESFKNIIPNMYEVSNHGRVWNAKNFFYCGTGHTPKCYPKAKFRTTRERLESYDVHRIVASLFVPGHDAKHDIVNHVDNDKRNNHWRNLEWCDYSWNNKHFMAFRRDIDLLDRIRTLILEYGSPTQITRMLRDQGVELSDEYVKFVKIDNEHSTRSWMYTQEEIAKLHELTRMRK